MIKSNISIIAVCNKPTDNLNSKYIAYKSNTVLDSKIDSKFFGEVAYAYWAWKNIDANYYGFFHYRRFLSFKELKNKYPVLEEMLSNDFLNKYGLDDANLKATLNQYDIVLPYAKNLIISNGLFSSMRRQYKYAFEHDIKDLDNAIAILHELHPEFDQYAKKALKMKKVYFNNIFVIKKKYFFEYCEWLFPILFKFHEGKDYSNSSVYNKRSVGFIAERLFTIYMLYIKDKYKDIKIKECPLVLIGTEESFDASKKKGIKLKISEFTWYGRALRCIYHTIIGR
ncbi:MAG: DUF4422 domain-containing protein [Bacilli bacterium]|nr:DUF4422 domain-containing protein [Bacilli bacterium]